jgi:hypothetical protein
MRHFYVIHNWELRNMRLLPSSMTIRHALITEKQTCTSCIVVPLRNYITRHKDAQTCTPCIVVPLLNYITRHKDTQDKGSAATHICTLCIVVPLRNYITRHKDAQDKGSAATHILTSTLHATEW